MERTELKVEGMHCDGCKATVERVLGGLEGVESAEADWKAGRVVVERDPTRAGDEALRAAIEDAGYDVAPA